MLGMQYRGEERRGEERMGWRGEVEGGQQELMESEVAWEGLL